MFDRIEQSRGLVEESVRISNASKTKAEVASLKAQEAESKAEEFFNNINNNIKKVFLDLKLTEIEYYINEIDEDISEMGNLHPVLIRSKLVQSDYHKLKKIFIKYIDEIDTDTTLPNILKLINLMVNHFQSILYEDREMIHQYLSALDSNFHRIKNLSEILHKSKLDISDYEELKKIFIKNSDDQDILSLLNLINIMSWKFGEILPNDKEIIGHLLDLWSVDISKITLLSSVMKIFNLESSDFNKVKNSFILNPISYPPDVVNYLSFISTYFRKEALEDDDFIIKIGSNRLYGSTINQYLGEDFHNKYLSILASNN